MATTTLLLNDAARGTGAASSASATVARGALDLGPAFGRDAQREPLLREALGMSLRAYRADKGVSLRNLAAQARVSSGYLSELERGRKEVSSELLKAICDALDTTVAEVLLDAVSNLSLHALTDELEHAAPAAAEA
ncbi:helix-turn-helix transcriptional regulator [Corynebacterium sp.]|uniref:helix-turn-helix domain-containing protein n=1 Tax=Corynebacterium sp. TaxID=1720 RepID=UPI002A91F937|nr:helix-turn-helix transcriptional regulator [Corynebacterium sp.]MDY5786003.1 helix-turn-helix transcriptional regulator [Corynebacterium sp.]